ncbi:UDP-N-acetylmuramoylalanine--D-glutamate ligase [hydrothermal vent metagenome]|uniref:UDP-N-acetylmuramoylalanine--D-glutamate ligase n=1 Tax=hydrothermal vent metagenome TaxID=652676 RepID=A0A1W1C0K6_9ZZZZ
MQRVSLFGYGKTTKALAKEFKRVTFYDDKCHKPFVDQEGYSVRPAFEFEPLYSDLEIPSPGIAPTNPLIQKAQNLKSEYDYFASVMPRSIWVSGTNGKTTTTQMIEHLLKKRGAISGGNIGTPLANLPQDASLWILETSSFMLHYTYEAKPDIYVLLPIKPDHISWHGSMESYVEAKLKPLAMMQEGDVAIVPKEYMDYPTQAMLIGYENAEELAEFFGIEQERVGFEGAFLLDALLALAVEKILFERLSYDRMDSFQLEPHRQEELRDGQGRLWVNDTKATNIDATLSALERYKSKKIHLILGGDDKGVDLSPLFEYLCDKNIHTYHIGSNKKRLSTKAKHFGIEFTECNNLEDAIIRIDKALEMDEVALLSPAAASLDEFQSYAHRGNLFKEIVKSLP